MGGERETTVCSAKDVGKKTTIGDIRVHEANGEVHFHADSSKLKVAVPSGIWYRDWTRLIDDGGSRTFIDIERGTRLMLDLDVGDHNAIDAHISIDEIDLGDTFKALHEFTSGKK